jgi:hypothetical protein
MLFISWDVDSHIVSIQNLIQLNLEYSLLVMF